MDRPEQRLRVDRRPQPQGKLPWAYRGSASGIDSKEIIFPAMAPGIALDKQRLAAYVHSLHVEQQFSR